MTPRFVIAVPLFSRRGFLAGSGAAVAVGLVGGCDTLSIPPPVEAGPLSAITPQADFYLQSCCGVPDVDPSSFVMEIVDGATGAVLGSLDQAFVQAIASPRSKEHTLQCIGANPRFLFVGNAVWTGLPFSEVLALLGVVVPTGAVELVFFGADGYDTSIPISDLETPLWLVWGMNEEPLTLAHGAPFRFLVPGRYGTKNPKWVERLELAAAPHVGYWERQGWSNAATYRPNALTLAPAAYSVIGEGTLRVQGSAFAGFDPVARVEWTDDDGGAWQDATITYASEEEHTWRLWSFEFAPPGPGSYTLRTRVTTESGATSVDSSDGEDRLEGYNGGMEIRVEVT